MPTREGKEHPSPLQQGQSSRGCPTKGSHQEELPVDVWVSDKTLGH
ncbi:hypothetical protein [Kamptonema formosum]|nr:hypothetical protein [Oscillatoria sp. PCC 10802]